MTFASFIKSLLKILYFFPESALFFLLGTGVGSLFMTVCSTIVYIKSPKAERSKVFKKQ